VNLQRVPLIVISLSVITLLVGVYLWRSSPGAVAQRERAAREAQALDPVASAHRDAMGALEVEARTVRSRSVPVRAELSAVLGPARRVRLAAEVEGRVVAVPAEQNRIVEEGAAIVQIERSLLAAAAGRTEAALKRARANYELSQLELERQKGLRERRATSDAEFDRAASSEQARLADVQEARATLDDARVRLEKATIRAPFAGVVENLDLEPGSYLRSGEHVADVLDLSEIEIEVGVTDREVVALRQGDPATVIVDVFPEESFGAVVRRVARAPHDTTQKYPVELRVPNLDGRLLPGMLGRVRFDLGHEVSAIRIPRGATRQEFEIDYVYVVSGRNDVPVVERRRIVARAVPFRSDLIEVVEGLREGEQIAVTRLGQLRDGLPVRVKGANDS